MLYELKNFKATDITNVCIKTIKTSSELDKKYKTENLIDDDFSTAWVEGASGNGIGEYIDIEFKDYYISSIFLCNGYAKNENIYNANNKIKSLKMNVKYKNYYSENYTEEEEILNLDNRYFSEFNTKYSFYFLDPIFGDVETRISKYKVDKIRLTINDVYRGSKYNDTCVSEIKVYGYLK